MELTLKEYLSGLKGQRVAVVGIGVSNTPSSSFWSARA